MPTNEDPKQLQHSPSSVGGPCVRCGLRYSPQTAYIPCFLDGETKEQWKARLKKYGLELEEK
jgi:hypothetical protein